MVFFCCCCVVPNYKCGAHCRPSRSRPPAQDLPSVLSLFISFLIRWTEKNNRLQFVQTEEEEEEKKTRQRDREISLSKITLSSKTHHLVTLGDARLPTTGNCVDFNSFIVLFCSTTGFLVVFILGKTSIDRSLSNRFFFIVAIKMDRSPEAKRYTS